MAINGKYEPKTQSIAIDLAAHLFKDPTPVQFHEMAHFYLSKYTNYGAAYSILSEILLYPQKLKVDQGLLSKTIFLLHQGSYLTQEGFAHFIQAHDLYKKEGFDAVKDLEDHIPHKAKEALSYLRFGIGKGDKFCDELTAKLSRLSMNTNLPNDILADSDLALSPELLEKYLSEDSNLPDKRYVHLAYAVEKNPEIIESSDEEICNAAGISFYPPLSNLVRANLINFFSGLTTEPANLTEADIRTLSGTEEALLPGFESMIMRDANIETNALTGGRTNMELDKFLEKAQDFRTIFIFNNPETFVPAEIFGFFGFSGERVTYNGRFNISSTAEILANDKLTKVVDSHTFDFTKNELKDERSFIGANIVWYKSFQDFKIFLEMMQTLKLKIQMNSFAFTEEHKHWFFILKIDPHSNLLHVLSAFPNVASELEAKDRGYEIEHTDFLELIKGNELHINNFFHDMLGIPWQFNLVEMVKGAEEYLNETKKKIDSGLPPYEPCICGSERKHKWCHHFKS